MSQTKQENIMIKIEKKLPTHLGWNMIRLVKVIGKIGKGKKGKAGRPGKTWMKKIEEVGLRRENMVNEIKARTRGNWRNMIELDKTDL